MWKSLYERLVAKEGYELVRPADEVIDAAFGRAETELQIRMPDAYKAFIRLFGPGELGGYFRIYGPPIPGFPDCGKDILEENRIWRDPEGFWATTAKPEPVARLICFSSTIGGDACFWDPMDVRADKTNEYGIYVLSHDSHEGEVTKAAESFKEFIESVCLGNGFDKIGGGWGEEGGPHQRFLPEWLSQ